MSDPKVMVELVHVRKHFKTITALQDICLQVYAGEFFTLLGPSGCGKTTTLRMIGGFDTPDSGDIYLDGRPVYGKRPFERDVNTVFQSYALFPHMTVRQNVGFGLKMKGVPKQESEDRIAEALKLVKMYHYADRYPKNLSGGEQQRVAVARAIVNNPQVLLLDEPLGSLDLKLRKEMQIELKQLQKRLGITFIYVTHDQEEALTMSDRVAVMNKGVLEQVDSPVNIYLSPRTRFIADFIGETNLIECQVEDVSEEQGVTLRCNGEKICAASSQGQYLAKGDTVYLSVRPENITVGYQKSAHINEFQAKVQEVIFIGHSTKVITSLPFHSNLVASIPSQVHPSALANDVFLHWEPEKSVIVMQ